MNRETSIIPGAPGGHALPFRHSFVICHSSFGIASTPAFVFLQFLAKVLFHRNLNHLKHFGF